MENYLQALEGISYGDWVKLRTAIDRAFIIQKCASERQLKLTNTDVAEKLILSQFGRIYESGMKD